MNLVKLIQNNNVHLFYKSTIWRHLRGEVLKEQHYECQVCKQRGVYTKAVVVHHIKHIKEHPELALTKSNLMSVCSACHNELHPEKAFKFKFKEPINEERW